MDHLARLIVAGVLLLVSSAVFALGQVPSITQTVWRGGSPVADFPTPGAACDYVASSSGDGWLVTSVDVDLSSGIATCHEKKIAFCNGGTVECDSFGAGTAFRFNGVQGCPSGAQQKGTSPITCVCPLNTQPDPANSSCIPYSCPAAGSYTAVTSPDQLVPNAGDNICSGGCGFVPSSWKIGADGKTWATWPFKSAGSACTGDPLAANPLVDTGDKNDSNPAPVPCGSNMCPGTVNGTLVCVACSSQGVQGPSSSSSAPAGSASGADGTTTTSNTSCNGTKCTTTTTTTSTTTGAVTGTTTKTEDQGSWCQENPASPLCKDSLWGGSCDAGYTCDGDAIQCAIARRTYQSACQFDVTDSVLSSKGIAGVNGGAHPAGHPYTDADSVPVVFADGIDQTEYFAGGCVSDMTVPLGIGSVTIPFSRICASLAMLGNVMVGLCMLAALFIVFRS